MKAIDLRMVVFGMLIAICLLNACKKGSTGGGTGGGPCPGCPGTLTSINASIKKGHSYAAGTQILVESTGYPKSDTTTVRTNTIFTSALPFNDTIVSHIETINYVLYLAWKITDGSNNILSSGSTPKMTTGVNTIQFDISY